MGKNERSPLKLTRRDLLKKTEVGLLAAGFFLLNGCTPVGEGGPMQKKEKGTRVEKSNQGGKHKLDTVTVEVENNFTGIVNEVHVDAVTNGGDR